MERDELLTALRRLSVETGSLACLGCLGCDLAKFGAHYRAIMQYAIAHLEVDQTPA